MLVVKAKVVGMSELKMDPMPDEQLKRLRDKTKSLPKDWTIEEEAASKIYRNPEGQIAIPRKWLWGALVNAGIAVKLSKRQLSTDKKTILGMFLRIRERWLPLTAPGEIHWEACAEPGRNPNTPTKAAVCIVRPCFEEWGFEVTLEVHDWVEIDGYRMGMTQLNQLFELAGTGMGLGPARPHVGGDCGTFKVISWKILDESDAESAALAKTELAKIAKKKTGQETVKTTEVKKAEEEKPEAASDGKVTDAEVEALVAEMLATGPMPYEVLRQQVAANLKAKQKELRGHHLILSRVLKNGSYQETEAGWQRHLSVEAKTNS